MKNQTLNFDQLNHFFQRLDEEATAQVMKPLSFIIIGSAVLIQHGMPDRTTNDIDFWKTTQHHHDILKKLADKVGISFNPQQYSEDEPYLQWVAPDFVHMPPTHEWVNELLPVWSGTCITIQSPPIGIMVGSKLAVGREQDLIDIHYITSKYPEWKESLEHWIPYFSNEDQEIIQDNLILIEMYSRQQSKTPKA